MRKIEKIETKEAYAAAMSRLQELMGKQLSDGSDEMRELESLAFVIELYERRFVLPVYPETIDLILLRMDQEDLASFVGRKIKFSEEKGAYIIRACNDQYLVCTKPFNPQRTTLYTIVDLHNRVRGTENLWGPGRETDQDCQDVLCRLVSGESAISSRNQIPLNIESLEGLG